jgi:superfamily I DNA/RNA helicase
MGVDSARIEQFRRDAMEAGSTLYHHCEGLNVPEFSELFHHLETLDHARDDLAAFRSALLSFPHLLVEDGLFPEVGITINELTNRPASIASVIKQIHEKFGLLDSEESVSDEDKVLVATMYSAKGLEAKYVFIMWMNATFIPAHGRNEEEERRVLYVALTRAKTDAYLLFHETFDGRRRIKEQAMSPFLWEIAEHLNIARVTVADFR